MPIQMKINKDLIVGDTTTSLEDVVINMNGLKGTVLWKNPNPTIEFANNQTISIPLSDYDFVDFIYYDAANSPIFNNSGLIPIVGVYQSYMLKTCFNARIWYRNIAFNSSDNTMTFGAGNRLTNYGGSIDQNNVAVVPVYVVGYKTNLLS